MTPDELAQLEPGCVILSPGGRARTVVEVFRDKGRVYVTAPILHCSWTRRTYTILDRQQLKAYRLTREQWQFRRWKLGRLVLADCQGAERHGACCDVIGKFE